jgi:WD40 repeat protein
MTDCSIPLRWMQYVGQDRLLLFSQDKHLLMCNSQDGSVVWKIRARALVGDEGYHRLFTRPLCAWYEDGGALSLILYGEGTRYVRYVKETGGVEQRDLSEFFNADLSEIVSIPRWKDLILGPHGVWRSKAVLVLDLSDTSTVRWLKPKPAMHHFTSLEFSHDATHAAATGDSVYVWDLETGKRLNDVYQPADDVLQSWRPGGGYCPSACAFSHDSRLLAVGTRGSRLLIFEVASGKLVVMEDLSGEFQPTRGPYWGSVEYITFPGDTQYILGAGQSIRVYNLPAHRWMDVDAFSADENIAVVGGVAVHGHSIFVCDYVGNLRRFDWEVTDPSTTRASPKP